MGRSFAKGLCLMVVLYLAVPGLATVYTVGDTAGWTMGVDYTTWTAGKTFAVGDTLVFNYGGGHTVDEVGASDYTSCTIGNSLSTDSTGSTSIPLKTAGTHYFICGIVGHCGTGMKLAVTVAAGGAGGPSTTTPSGDTATSGTTSPPLVTTPPSRIPNDSSSGTSLSAFMAGFVSWFALSVLILS